MAGRLLNFINGGWHAPDASEVLDVLNPASAAVLAKVPLSPANEVDQAVTSALKAFPAWRRTPAGERIQPLFKLEALQLSLSVGADHWACEAETAGPHDCPTTGGDLGWQRQQ